MMKIRHALYVSVIYSSPFNIWRCRNISLARLYGIGLRDLAKKSILLHTHVWLWWIMINFLWWKSFSCCFPSKASKKSRRRSGKRFEIKSREFMTFEFAFVIQLEWHSGFKKFRLKLPRDVTCERLLEKFLPIFIFMFSASESSIL